MPAGRIPKRRFWVSPAVIPAGLWEQFTLLPKLALISPCADYTTAPDERHPFEKQYEARPSSFIKAVKKDKAASALAKEFYRMAKNPSKT